jgi:homoserine kinase
MVSDTTAAFLAATGLAPEGFAFRIDGEVPPARGLGSSVTVIAGVLAGLNVLRGAGLSRERLVALATELEGHPDNASAGILGGFCVSRCDPATGAYLDSIRVVIPSDLIFVVVSPESEMLTKAARGVLPASLPYFDAVRSINSASYLVAAFATGQFDRLRHAVADFMHEPYRLPSIPGARAAIDAGCAAGALTGWLSGSGSSVLCVCRRGDVAAVSAAMSAAFTQAGLPSVARALTADNEGLRIE